MADDDLECFEQSQWAFITEIGPPSRTVGCGVVGFRGLIRGFGGLGV